MAQGAVSVRPETSADVVGIAQLHRAVFSGPVEAELVDALRKEGALVASLIALGNEEVAGHVAFSDAGRIAWLGPVGVLPRYQRQGIGSALIQAGIWSCKSCALDGVVVLGDPSFYGRFGFSVDAAQGFESRFAGSHLMALPLGAKAFHGPLPEPMRLLFACMSAPAARSTCRYASLQAHSGI